MMHWKYRLDTLDLDNDCIFYEDVESVSAVEDASFVGDRDAYLPRHLEASIQQFVAKAYLVR